MIKIDSKEACCGCSACSEVCPVHCISMQADSEGFLYPQIDSAACINCRRCEQVCPILRTDREEWRFDDCFPDPCATGGYHTDSQIRSLSSSGGAFSAFAGLILERKGLVAGTVWTRDGVRHILASTPEEIALMRGSKYVQSDLNHVFSKVKEALEQGKYVLFTGTPCQTAGLAAYLGKKYENLYLLDFICHGVPSPKVFDEYMNQLEKNEKSPLVSFSFREKDKGWFSFGLQLGTKASFANGKTIRRFPALRDTYMNAFLNDLDLRPSCYQCRFKTIPKAYADITIADFWGVNRVLPEMNDNQGTSLILFHNEHGKELFELAKNSFTCQDCSWKEAVRRNPPLLKSVSRPMVRDVFYEEMEKNGYDWVSRKYLTFFRSVFRKMCIVGRSFFKKS